MKMIDSVNIIQPREAKGTKEGRNKGKPDLLKQDPRQHPLHCPPELVGRERVDVSTRLKRQRPGDELDVIPLHVCDDHDAHLREYGMGRGMEIKNMNLTDNSPHIFELDKMRYAHQHPDGGVHPGGWQISKHEKLGAIGAKRFGRQTPCDSLRTFRGLVAQFDGSWICMFRCQSMFEKVVK